MKNFLELVFLSIVFIGCKTDNFYDTRRVIETDKTVYNVGDKINMTLKIIPQEDQKEIRIFRNYKNLEVSFALLNGKENRYNSDRSEHSENSLDATDVETMIISRHKPFVKTFVGEIIENGDKVAIHFPELKTKAIFDREKIKRGTLRIHGYCNPINPEPGASLEEYFEVKDIKINIK